MKNGSHGPDIDERALQYGARAVRLLRHLQLLRDPSAVIIGRQFLRSATSVGANLAEAKSGETRADFVHKCAVAQKEIRESRYWLRLLTEAEIVEPARLADLLRETDEITAVLTAIIRKAKQKTR